jgi:hypothetical protein
LLRVGRGNRQNQLYLVYTSFILQIYICTLIEHLLNYITISCIKSVICNYVDIFKKTDVDVLTFCQLLITVSVIDFEIVFQQSYDDMW